MTATATAPQTSLIVQMANRYGLEANKFYSTLEKTILPAGKQASQEQVAAFLVVANHHQLNPFTREIFAFPNQSGGITPIVSVDGWLTLINRQPNLDGIEYEDHIDSEGRLTAITCRIYRKDRARPSTITEYMNECKRNTSTWSQWPARMLRHKALIQCARQAFGFAGIYDPDEAERIAENGNGNGTMAAKTQDKAAELRERIAQAQAQDQAVEAETTDELPIIDAELVDPPAPDDTDQTPPDYVEPGLFEKPADEPAESETTAEESQLANLIAFAKEKLREITGGSPRKVTEITKSRNIDRMDLKAVNAFIAELEEIESKA